MGTPVIVSKGAPWGSIQEKNAGWWVDIGVEPLAQCLDKALSYNSKELSLMGLNGIDWMEKDFSWNSVGLLMTQVYQWLIDPSAHPKPDCVNIK